MTNEPLDLDDIERRIADGIYGDDRMTKEGRNDAFSALNEIIAEVERLRAGARSGEVHLDLEAIKKRHLDPEKNRGRTYYLGHIEVDLAACVEEIDRLREEVHELRLMVEEAARAENANAEDVKRERAAVVAYLRAESRAVGASPDEKRILTWVSGRIRGGEHRREEEKP